MSSDSWSVQVDRLVGKFAHALRAAHDLTRVQLVRGAYIRSRGQGKALVAAPAATAISAARVRNDPGQTALNHGGVNPRKENRQ